MYLLRYDILLDLIKYMFCLGNTYYVKLQKDIRTFPRRFLGKGGCMIQEPPTAKKKAHGKVMMCRQAQST